MEWKSARRDDDQLIAILDETGTWTIHGRAAEVLMAAASLRDAIERALVMAAAGQKVTAISRRLKEDILTFYGQMERLWLACQSDG
jgi:hypothetical protein